MNEPVESAAMSLPAAAEWPHFGGAVSGIDWPAILPNEGAHLLALCFQFDRSQWWSADELRSAQLAQLRQLMSHAVATTPYYGAPAYRDWLACPDARAWDAFLALPVVGRRDVQRAGQNLRARSLPSFHGVAIAGETSGSTGIPLRFWTTPLSHAVSDAVIMRDHVWHHRDFRLRHAFIRSRDGEMRRAGWGPPTNLLFAAGESASLPGHLTTPEQQAAWLEEFDPHYLLAQPVTVRELARLSLAGKLSLPSLRQVRTLGETVGEDLRDLIQRAWGVPRVDLYSASEFGTVALQCPDTGLYHAQSEVAIVEILDEAGRPCGPGETGRIVVTPLHNFAMPLVRYATGDYAVAAGPCACGRGLPALERILGRHRNRLRLPDGSSRWLQLSNMRWLDVAPAVERFQVRQERDLSLAFRYEAAAPLDSVCETRIRDEVLLLAGAQLPFSFERVDALPIGANGKLEDFVCLAAEEAAGRGDA